ncbi:hypothetical protein [Fodinicola acaciae]|uniref:hypothetical protein n=1 Tax=Fodinicola acaciae TaxID=2681555 RepID=UPI001FE93883|nr:hypothetical protein [Fodinicola acaciae]
MAVRADLTALRDPPGAGKTVARMVAGVNAELMKNAAEIGQLRMLHQLRNVG